MGDHRLLFLVLVILSCITFANCVEVVEFSSLPYLFNDTRKRASTYLNTDYLGTGYHILKGNPWTFDSSTGRDPGWITNRILSFTYNTGQTTTDNKYYVPDGTSIQSIGNCQYTASSVQTFGARSYTSNLQTYASVSGGSFDGSFSLSAGYSTNYAYTTVNQDVLVQTVADCKVYTGSLYPFSTYTYTPTLAFVNATASLPTSYDSNNPGAFINFFNDWGTHISQQIYMGGRASSTYMMTYSQYNDLQSSSIDISAAASASWGIYSGDATASSAYSTSSTNYFKSKSTLQSVTYLGPPPPINPSNLANWQNSVINSPFVLSYVLVPIHTLVQSMSGYSAQASAIQAALANLCAKTSACQPTSSVPLDPTHTPTAKSCRWCTGCGGNYPVESGRRNTEGDWGTWDTYDGACGGTYTETWGAARFCCGGTTTDNTVGMCRLCASCGGSWSIDQGSRINAGDWGTFQMWGNQCTGGYDDNWAPPHLCCASDTQCKMCDSYCGSGLSEVGRIRHNGDWGPWNLYGQGCTGAQQYGTWNEAALCCK